MQMLFMLRWRIDYSLGNKEFNELAYRHGLRNLQINKCYLLIFIPCILLLCLFICTFLLVFPPWIFWWQRTFELHKFLFVFQNAWGLRTREWGQHRHQLCFLVWSPLSGNIHLNNLLCLFFVVALLEIALIGSCHVSTELFLYTVVFLMLHSWSQISRFRKKTFQCSWFLSPMNSVWLLLLKFDFKWQHWEDFAVVSRHRTEILKVSYSEYFLASSYLI